MRKLLLSTASVAAIVALAACSDQSAQNDDAVNPTDQTAMETTVPSSDVVPVAPDTDTTTAAIGDNEETATEPRLSAEADAGAAAGIEEARLAVADARDAIQAESESAAVDALLKVERAVTVLDFADEAQQSVDTARNAVADGDFQAALAAMDDVEAAIEANSQAAVRTPATADEPAATTTMQ